MFSFIRKRCAYIYKIYLITEMNEIHIKLQYNVIVEIVLHSKLQISATVLDRLVS